MKIIKKFLQNNISEITKDTALRLYGACIAIAFLISHVYWISVFMAKIISQQRVCWPFFENCFLYNLNEIQIHTAFYIFAFLSACGVLLFLLPRYITLAYWWLMGIFALNLLMYFQDFQFRSNQITILNWVTFVFLFWPNKRNCLRYLIVIIYFCASLLKFNMAWISGNNLYKPLLWIREPWITPACLYVIALEFFIVFGLLSKKIWLFWLVFIQLMIFHIVSWPVVGFFYPTLMFALLLIFPLIFFIRSQSERDHLIPSFIKGKQPISTYVILIILLSLHCARMVFPGDVKTTGEGRLIGLDMFDSNTQCSGFITLKFQDAKSRSIPIPYQSMPNRYRCDPVVYFSIAKQECWKLSHASNFLDLDILYSASQSKDNTLKLLVDTKDFCKKNLHYNMIASNDWIIKH